MTSGAPPDPGAVAEVLVADSDLAAAAGMLTPGGNRTATIRPCSTKGCPP
jgi:hypothetical protein